MGQSTSYNKKPTYTKKDVFEHNKNNPKYLWLIANKRVYDVTELIPYHPGGRKALFNKIGKDCTKDYLQHSKGGRKLWVKYCIGYLQE